MLESLTIFRQSGLILYQYNAEPSLVLSKATTVASNNNSESIGDDPDTKAAAAATYTQQVINTQLIIPILLNPTKQHKKIHIHEGVTVVWQRCKTDDDMVACALYPDILFEGPRQYLQQWSQTLLQQALQEYALFAKNYSGDDVVVKLRPDPAPFDQTFRVLLEQSKGTGVASSAALSSVSSAAPGANKKESEKKAPLATVGGKQPRHWGEAKVTDQAMAALDFSQHEHNQNSPAALERALQEARAAYLPTEADLAEVTELVEEESSDNDETTRSTSWSTSVTSVLQQLVGNKILTDADLDAPLQQLQQLLTSKNVADPVARQLCDGVRAQLRNQRLASLTRVRTAIQQACEHTVRKLLTNKDLDLLRAVLAKRDSSGVAGLLTSLTGSTQRGGRKPYVICVMGINGVGKSTSLAKLAYYLKTNGCRPLLVAGDTFRSGAVEQLQVHARCLDLPVFSQGYSKDPSAVVTAAMQNAVDNNNDVVLVDTAGRMQNNVPLMKALGKLVTENQPDCMLLVAEALVGHDGLSQFAMFQNALGARRKVDGLILTKFDTVADKVGAALTLMVETNCPIAFCGTGQKYHHLQKLPVPHIVASLFR